MWFTVARRAPKPNLTGFDPKAFAAAAANSANDPWARREAWRYSGPFTRANRFKNAFPGFGIAAVAFAIYCGYESFLNEKHEHAESHH